MTHRVTFTADHYTEESIAEGSSVENGYVNVEWNKHSIMEEGDEFFKDFDTREEAEAYIEENIGAVEPSGDSFYAQDPEVDYEGDTWMLAGHIDVV
jgi:hypothetical protein